MLHRPHLFLYTALLVTMPLAGCATQTGDDGTGGTDDAAHTTIMALARGLAPALDTPEEALAAGYRPDAGCVPGMGVHWIKQDLLDTELDAEMPEVVLFLPDSSNLTDTAGDRFLGLEWVVVTQDTEHNTTETVPRFHGVPLVGPMPGHFPGMPWHAELHVYLADGLESGADFAESADVACPIGTEHGDAATIASATGAAKAIDTPAEAIAAGYVPATACVPGMGYHWLNPGLFDTTIDADAPEVVLFMHPADNPFDTGNATFLGVEYVAVTQGTEHNTTATVWQINGRSFDGPMPGHFPGMPWHAEVHVWLGAYMGSDPFTASNAAIVCPPGSMAPPMASAVLHGVTPAGVAEIVSGFVNVTEAPTMGSVLIEIAVRGLTPGEHGVHVHVNGSCDPAPAGTSPDPIAAGGAGGHFNPDGGMHGEHAGDLGNIVVGQDGTGRLVVTKPLTLEPGAKYGIAGRSLIVHAQGDDGTTDPSGNSGARVLCGILEAPSAVTQA